MKEKEKNVDDVMMDLEVINENSSAQALAFDPQPFDTSFYEEAGPNDPSRAKGQTLR